MYLFLRDTPTTKIYTLSLHDALPISSARAVGSPIPSATTELAPASSEVNSVRSTSCTWRLAASSGSTRDRKSTRQNSSHGYISYAVICLKKKNICYDR